MDISLNSVWRFRKALAAVVLAGSTSVLAACSDGFTQAAETDSVDENITIEEVAGGTENLIGQEVTVRSEVAETLDDSAFLLEDDRLFGGEDVLVLNTTGQPFVLMDGDETPVQVTGEVMQFTLVDIETEYGLDLDPELYADYEDMPAIAAQSIALSPEPEELTSNPEKYYNRRIAVQGEVEDMLAPYTFTLDEDRLFGGEDLLVIAPTTTAATEDGEIVTVTGVLRPYIQAEFEMDYDLQWDLSFQEQIEAEYTEKPVFVADEVYPSAS